MTVNNVEPETESEAEKRQREQISKYNIDDTFDRKKFDKMDYVHKQKYANELEDKHIIYRTATKTYIIAALAEALEKQEYPLLEIKEKIIEGFEGRVDANYVGKCLPERFKRPQRIAGGKKALAKIKAGAGASGTGQLLEEPELQFKDDEEDDESEDYTGGTSGTNKDSRESLPDIQPSIAYTEEYVQSLEYQIKAMNGSLPYADIQATQRITKISKQNLIKLEEASKKSKKEVYIIIDTRNQEIIQVYSDKDYAKVSKTHNTT